VLQHLHGRFHVLAHIGVQRRAAADPGQVELDRGQRAADVVVDLAGDVGALLLDAGLQVLGQFGQPLARFGQLGVGPGLGAAGLGHVQRALDDVRQPLHVVLEQVIVHPAVHRIDRGGLADGAREDDERQLDADLAHERPGVQAVEAGQVVVGQHHVVPPRGQLALEILQRVHQCQLAGHLAALQGELHQRVIDAGVFQVEDADRRAGGGVRHADRWLGGTVRRMDGEVGNCC